MNKKPHKKARKLIIEDETWYWLLTGGRNEIVIWEPNGRKNIIPVRYHLDNPEDEQLAVTPFDVRNIIDVTFRDIPQYVIDDKIAERKRELKAQRHERMRSRRREVIVRARRLVGYANELAFTYCWDDYKEFKEENERWLDELVQVLAYGITPADKR